MNVVVEGILDEAVMIRLFEHCGKRPGPMHVKRGKPNILSKLNGYNQAARYRPFVVVLDLDQDHACPPELLDEVLPAPSDGMLCCVAVRSVESWLIADRDRLASFISVPVSRLSPAPENLPDAKRHLTDVAAGSRRRDIRDGMPPTVDGMRREGPIYTSKLVEFVRDAQAGWRPDVAASRAPSLARVISRL